MELLNQLTAEDYNVYSDLLRQMVKPQKLFVIRDHTMAEWKTEELDEEVRKNSLEYMKKIFGLEQNDEILSDYYKKNEQPYPLERKFNFQTDYILVSDTVNEIFNKDNRSWESDLSWKEFYEMYPGAYGITEFSRVGFNSEKNKALVEMGNTSGPLAGWGYLVLLEKKNNSWIIQKKAESWIS